MRCRFPGCTVLSIVMLAAAGPAYADLALDTGFGAEGIVSLDAGTGREILADLVVQDDGRYLTVGFAEDQAGNDVLDHVLLARYNTDGTPDTDFGPDGTGVLKLLPGPGVPVNGQGGIGFALALQPDQKIVVAGTWTTTADQPAIFLLRLNPDGSYDDDADADPGVVFGSGGVVVLDAEELTPAVPGQVIVDVDGRILLSGTFTGDGQQAFVARFLPEGSLDPAFGTDGIWRSDLEGSRLNALRIHQGGFVAAGAVGDGIEDDLLAVRLLADGTPDPAFGDAGIVRINLFTDYAQNAARPSSEIIQVIAVQPDGKLLLGGGLTRRLGTLIQNADPLLIRLNADGSRDASFGATGLALLPDTGPGEFVLDMVVRPAGDIVIVGQGLAPFQVSAGGNGRAALEDELPAELFAAALSADGSVIAAGERVRETASDPQQAVVTRVTTTDLADPVDLVPDAFELVDLEGQEGGIEVISNVVTVTGIEAPTAISVSNAEYSIGCEADGYGAAAGEIGPGETVCVRLTTSTTPGATVASLLTVGGYRESWLVTTDPGDIEPDPFAFTPQTDVPLSAFIQSDAVTITGLENPAPVSVTNGEYSVGCTTQFTTFPGSIANGQTICVRHTSGRIGLEQVTTTLTIGGVSADFTSTTVDVDASPDPFSFTDQTEVELFTEITSAPVTITGIDAAVPIAITGGSFAVGCTGTYKTLGLIRNGETLCVRHTSAGTGNTTTSTTVTIGDVSDTFSSTTRTADQVPDQITIEAVTNADASSPVDSAPVTISGIDAPTSISVSGGSYSIGCTGTFVSAAGTVTAGDTVCVRVMSAAGSMATTFATLRVGTVSAPFSVTTGDVVPDPFSFEDTTGVRPSSTVTSAPVTITGLTARALVTVTNGQYAVNCGGIWTTEPGHVANGETICVRHVSSIRRDTAITTTLTVGGVSGTFTSTTTGDKPFPGSSAFDPVSVLLLVPAAWGAWRRGKRRAARD